LKPVGFDWDDEKADANLAKHGVSFEEAMTVFHDDDAAIRTRRCDPTEHRQDGNTARTKTL